MWTTAFARSLTYSEQMRTKLLLVFGVDGCSCNGAERLTGAVAKRRAGHLGMAELWAGLRGAEVCGARPDHLQTMSRVCSRRGCSQPEARTAAYRRHHWYTMESFTCQRTGRGCLRSMRVPGRRSGRGIRRSRVKPSGSTVAARSTADWQCWVNTSISGPSMHGWSPSGKKYGRSRVGDPGVDWQQGYSITGAPLALKDMVLTGVAGGEFGIRGFVKAFDAKTGKVALDNVHDSGSRRTRQ